MSEQKVTLYMGRAGTGKTRACYERIRELNQEAAAQGTAAPSVILLVPDPSTYKVERALAESMPEQGFHSVRVVGFQRLAYQVFQAAGTVQKAGLSDTGRSLLLRAIMKQQEGQLSIFQQISRQPHFADVVKTLIKECHAFEVSPSLLRKGAELVSSPVLQHKLADLATVTEAYEEALQQRIGSTADTMDRLIDLLPTSPILEQAYVFIDGFHWFTPQQQRIVDILLAKAQEGVVTITLPTAKEGLTKYSRRGTLFYRTWETYQEFVKKYGAHLTIRPFTTYRRGRTYHGQNDLAALATGFFAMPMKRPASPASIPLYEAYNRKREVDAICRNILSFMEDPDQTWRWKDFAIMLRDGETYGDELEKALAHYEIPYFTDRRHPMVTHPLAELVEGLFDLVQSGFGHDALFRILKTDLFPLSREAVDTLENYCLEFGMYERQWLAEGPWEAKRSTVASQALAKAEAARLAAVNESRDVILKHLRPFFTFARTAHSGHVWSETLYAVLQELQVAEKLQAWYLEAQETHQRQEALAHEQMYQRCIALLEEVYQACGDDSLQVEEAALVFKEGLAEITYSLVPPTLDHVTVTTIDRSYANEFSVVFVPGLNEGVFPKRMGEEGIFRDQERDALREKGIPLAAGALMQAFNEQFLFYLACTRAKDYLFLSYCRTGNDGEKMEPSLVVKRLQQYGYVTAPIRIGLSILPGEEAQFIWRPKQSISLLATQFTPLEKGERVAPLWWQLYDWANTHQPLAVQRTLRGMADENTMPQIRRELISSLLLRDNMMTGSVTRLEKYNQCPFSFFAQYVLRITPRPMLRLAAPEIGTYLHENLRALGEILLRSHKQWHEVPEEEMDALIRSVAEDTAADVAQGLLQESAYHKHVKERLIHTLEKSVERLRLWSSRSAFSMYALEQDFGMRYRPVDATPQEPVPFSWDPLYIETEQGISIRLQGQIDRIDLWHDAEQQKTYGLIIDYKSSSATNIKAQDVYYGLRLQLLTYLLALEKARATLPEAFASYGEGEIVPAGLVYTYLENPKFTATIPMTVEDAKEYVEKKQPKNGGYFQKNLEVLEGIDADVANNTSPFVPIKLKKNGEFQSYSLPKLKTVENFAEMAAYTQHMIQETGASIVEGHFPIRPYYLGDSRPCQYCEYKTFCRFDLTQGQSQYRYLQSLQETEAMDAMVRILKEQELPSTSSPTDRESVTDTLTEKGGDTLEMD